MLFGGYNPVGSSELPFSNSNVTPSTATNRSRASSISSIHSNNSYVSQGYPQPPPLTLQQQQQHQLLNSSYHSPYSSQPSTPKTHNATIGLGLYTPGSALNTNSDNSNSHPTGYGISVDENSPSVYDGYGSGASSPASVLSYPYSTPPILNQQVQQHQRYAPPSFSRRNSNAMDVSSNVGGNSGRINDEGHSSGYDSPTGPINSALRSFNHANDGFGAQQSQQQQQQQSSVYKYNNQYSQVSQQRHYHRTHSRSHSNSSVKSLNIDTSIIGDYLPGPVSLSSASSSRRGSISDVNGDGGGSFYSRKKNFRLASNSAVGGVNSDADDDLYMNLGNKGSGDISPRRQRQKRLSRRPSKGNGQMTDMLNDWDMLLPSADPYGDEGSDGDDDDDDMTENERWKRKQLLKRGWESRRGQSIIIGVLVMVAVFIRIWKLAVPSAVV
ncbi:hypothetical protein BGZ49_010590 [Haplosporangium sp. Z 27]|nr:hypothetical protein BGZ49_010590 [Haplosporangium sp. Z 27]